MTLQRGTIFEGRAGSDRQSCAFPQVAVLPGGRWLAACRAAPTKTGTAGQHVLVSMSDDEGRSWSPATAPFRPPELDGKPGRFRSAAFTALGARRVLAALCWVDHSDPALPFFNEGTEGLLDTRILFAESADEGMTWSEPALMDPSPFAPPIAKTGPVLLLNDGTWACSFETNKPYEDPTPWIHSSILMFSTDGGLSWPRHTIVTRDPRVFYWDQRCSALPDGRLFNVFWTYDRCAAEYLNIHARESEDGGRTWSPLRDTGVPGQPAPVVACPNGRLALVYVDRDGPPTIRCRFSTDKGRTWPASSMLTLYESGLDGQTECKQDMKDAWAEMGRFSVGLPATAALPNGDILVVFYAGPETDRTNVEWIRLNAR